MIGANDLPKGWVRDRFKDVAALRNEKTDEKSSHEDYLELEDIEQGTGRLLSVRSTEDVESAVTKFYEGDVLFGKLRPYLEKYWLAEFDGKCTGEILAFKAERIHPHFLRYCVATDSFIKKCVSMSYGAKMPRVNWPTQMALINLPLPPEEEQTRIAQYLDQTCAAIDRAINLKQQQLEKLDQLRKSIIYKAVTKGLDDSVEMRDSGLDWCTSIPVHWNVSKLKRVFSEVDYGISESTSEDGFYAVLKMGNIVDREIAFTKIEYVTDVVPSLVLEKHDLLFNRTNSHDQVAKVGIFRGNKEENVTFASYLVRLRVGSRHDAEFLNYLLNTDEFLGLARKLAIPSVQQANLNPTRYGRMEVCVPPYDEQVDIRSFLDTKLANIRNAEEKTRKQIDVLRDYKKSLIHECVTGKRRITEADLRRAA